MIAYVLSGGGANGAFEAGVLGQLEEKGIRPDIVLGTSTGAQNALGYGFRGIKYLTDQWLSLDGIKDVFTNRGLLTPFYLFLGNGKGLYGSKPLKNLIDKAAIGTPRVSKVGACYVDLKTTAAKYVYSTPENPNIDAIREAVLASASIPVMNDAVNGSQYDGGVRHIAPLGEAIDQGADEIYVILCEIAQENQGDNFTDKIGNVINVANYTINTFVQGILWNDIKMAFKINGWIKDSNNTLSGVKHIKMHVYAPPSGLGDPQDFSKSHISAIWKQGLIASPILEDL